MKIKLKTVYASDKATYQVGEVKDFSDKEGKALINGGFGIEIKKSIVEKAIINPIETATIKSTGALIIKQKILKKSKKGKK